MSERLEDFFALSLVVKHKSSLQESLSAFVEPDVLDGENKYHCDQCDAKVAAEKRTCLRQLPPTVVLHLRRLDFDMEVFERLKINDFLQFPRDLDLRPYSTEADTPSSIHPPNYYRYTLAGVLMHRCEAMQSLWLLCLSFISWCLLQRHSAVWTLLLLCEGPQCQHTCPLDQLQRRARV